MVEIIVKETKQVRRLIGKEWKIVSKQGDDHKYDYTPETETVVTEVCEVYRQTVASLDLVAVINAVNGVGLTMRAADLPVCSCSTKLTATTLAIDPDCPTHGSASR